MFKMTVQRPVSPKPTLPQQSPKLGMKLLRSSQDPLTGKTHYNCSLEGKINTLPNVKVLLSAGIQTRNKPRLTQDSMCVSVQMPTPKPN